MSAIPRLPELHNEPVLEYRAGSAERAAVESELRKQLKEVIDIPMLIGGEEHRSHTVPFVCPHEHERQLAQVHQAQASHVQLAVALARDAAAEWASWSFEDRASVFLKAADLLAGPWRQVVNCATMLGQGKTVHQAEIDAACELVDFLRFNVSFAREICNQQPSSPRGSWNRVDYRPLEGFVYAVTPFNFTAIAGNLAAAPALMGNTVIWKPSATAALSNYLFMRLLVKCGLPPGVINFLPGPSETISRELLGNSNLAGIHFTGSTAVLNSLWSTVGAKLGDYKNYPRIVGETGGKGFVLAHPSAEVDELAVALVRGAFEYQGQKCSAASRAYLPASLWKRIKPIVIEMTQSIAMGPPTEFRNFMSAVIDVKAFDRIRGHIDQAKNNGCNLIAGGGADSREGYYVQPTVLQVSDPKAPCMREEIFGPVLSIFVYDDAKWDEVLELVDSSTAYGLTGAIFARDRRAITQAMRALRFTAGNLYLNDKPTGAVVGQQPFGGSRGSGTNDKAGSPLNLQRWTSPRTIKENFVPPVTYPYAFMD